jgi:hypothetical protein
MPISELEPGANRYGAQLGRAGSQGDPDTSARFYLQRVHLDSGGYDSGGAYWGLGSPLYRFESADGEASGYFRVERADVSAAFAARGGVRIGEPGYDAFARKFPHWHKVGTREAAKDIVRADYPDARFFN